VRPRILHPKKTAGTQTIYITAAQKKNRRTKHNSMATQQDNVLTHAMRGMIGSLVVFRNRGGKLVVAKKPKSPDPGKPLSEKQEASRRMFRHCSRYANSITEEQQAMYAAIARNGQTARNVAFSDAYFPPKVTAIAAAGYSGLPDELIHIEATDNIRVAGVRVEIRTGAGELVESGEAADDGYGENWTYHTTATNPDLPGSTVTVIARDTPGNLATETVTV
jgi:hypothetical protein